MNIKLKNKSNVNCTYAYVNEQQQAEEDLINIYRIDIYAQREKNVLILLL